jgi:localization factor PodJL
MTDQRGPWSVKGIDERAREAARLAARQRGMTLGEYLNDLLIDDPEEAAAFRRARPVAEAMADAGETSPAQSDSADALARLTQRIEAVEAKSALAITGIDQSVIGLVRRLENAEAGQTEVFSHVDNVMDDVRKTHEALQDKIGALEADDTATRSLEALKSLESALGKLAEHVYEENGMAQAEAEAIKTRVEAGFTELTERVEGVEVRVEGTLAEAAKRVEKAVESAELRTEGTAKHLSERFTALEEKVAQRMQTVDEVAERVGHVETDVSEALSGMEGLMTRIQERLNAAEETTNGAMQALENTFDALDKRIDAVAAQSSPQQAEALRKQFEERFEGLADALHASIEKTRAELASEIERAAAAVEPQRVHDIETKVGEVVRLGETMDERLSAVEAAGPGDVSAEVARVASEQISRLSAEVGARLEAVEARETQAIDKVGDHVGDLAGRLEKRIVESEHRSAKAIEQVGEQVAGVTTRLKTRQDEAIGELSRRLEEQSRDHETRLSDTLDRMSQRMERVHEEARQAVSPVQRAMASLVARVEALEDGAPALDPAPAAETGSLFTTVTGPDVQTDPETKAPERAEAREEFSEGLDLSRLDNWRDRLNGETADTEAPRSSGPFAEAAPQDIPPEPDFAEAAEGFADDPLAALDAPAPSRDTAPRPEEDEDRLGASEVREADIFAADDVLDDDTDPALAHPVDEHEIPEDWQQQEAAPPPVEQVVDEVEREDYLARARKAAQAAAVQGSRALKHENTPKASGRKVGKPVIIAASAVAVAAAAGGGYLYLRGKSADGPSQPPTSAAAPSVPASQPARAATSAQPAGEDPADDILFTEDGDAAAVPAVTGDEAPATVKAPAPSAEADPVAADSAETGTTVPEPRPAAPSPAPAPAPATPTLESAAQSGDRIAQYQLGVETLQAGRIAEGVGLIDTAARAGLPVAQYRLSKLYERGQGLPRDIAEARRWTDRAAKGGNVKAMHDLAVFFAEGEGGAQSYAEAAVWFRRAAEFGVVDSQFNLAVLYEQGLGVSPDMEQAYFWYQVAQGNGDEMAGARAREVGARLTSAATENTGRRAAAFEAKRPLNAPNGIFPPQAWEQAQADPVRSVQADLARLGFNPGPVDGQMGSRTRSAILAYQRANGLSPTGRIDDALLSSLAGSRASGPAMASQGIRSDVEEDAVSFDFD